MMIRPAHARDIDALLDVERAAFGGEAEADLVIALLGDPSALPIINLVAEEGDMVVGHALFTSAVVDSGGADVEATILAPLAVLPQSQRAGVGLALCREGIGVAERLGIGLIFLAGHIDYYPRLGFRPAFPLGLDAPYPFDPAVADAWMVLETRPGLIGSVRGTVTCADALMSPEMWAE
jgi:putative acetyltransferase